VVSTLECSRMFLISRHAFPGSYLLECSRTFLACGHSFLEGALNISCHYLLHSDTCVLHYVIP